MGKELEVASLALLYPPLR